MMANSCLLIETYVSFTKYEYLDTNGKSRDCFKYFFSNEPKFEVFSKDDIPNDFYDNVRCGILHNAETRKGWLITRKGNEPLFNAHTKTINAFKFANNLKDVLSDYRKKLLNSDYESDLIWTCFKDKLFLLFEII
jgi:hypothetical protein